MAQSSKKIRQIEALSPEDELHRLIDSLQRKTGSVDPRTLASDVSRAVREVRKRNTSLPS